MVWAPGDILRADRNDNLDNGAMPKGGGPSPRETEGSEEPHLSKSAKARRKKKKAQAAVCAPDVMNGGMSSVGETSAGSCSSRGGRSDRSPPKHAQLATTCTAIVDILAAGKAPVNLFWGGRPGRD